MVWLPGVVVDKNSSVYKVQIENVNTELANESDQQNMSLGKIVGAKLDIDVSDAGVAKTILQRTMQSEKNELSLPLQNVFQDNVNGSEDMIELKHLHEGAILYNLRNRYFRRMPYTYTGRICIAVNPYQWLDLYSKETMEGYNQKVEGEKPHVYAISRNAFEHMRKFGKDESILVSGESGM